MKVHYTKETPDTLKEQWPGQWTSFCWLNSLLALPDSIFILTTVKENGQPNACLQAGVSLVWDAGKYIAFMCLMERYHTTANIRRDRAWCINVPSAANKAESCRTIRNNALEVDEIAASGFTTSPCQKVQAPSIEECLISIECTLAWEREITEGGGHVVFAGEVVNIGIDERLLTTDLTAKHNALDMMLYMGNAVDPTTGESGEGKMGGFTMK